MKRKIANCVKIYRKKYVENNRLRVIIRLSKITELFRRNIMILIGKTKGDIK